MANIEQHASSVFEIPPDKELKITYDRISAITQAGNFHERRGGFLTALSPENRPKNRYINTVPYESNRVKLLSSPVSDYINASWIKKEKLGCQYSYICTQGPLNNTTEDFWKMILDYKIRVIVMLTKEYENSQEKCWRYWLPHRFDTVEVELLDERMISDSHIIERKIRVKDPSGQVLDVIQLQFVAWPDFGVPSSPRPVLELNEITNKLAALTPDIPIVVHCSAGVGRTGTFCTISSLLSKLNMFIEKNGKAEAKNYIQTQDVENTVMALRECRVLMVQKQDQFKFCYDTLKQATAALVAR